MPHRIFIIFCFNLLLSFIANSQTKEFKASITDNKGNLIPYSSVYINGNLVAISNKLGEFNLFGFKVDGSDSLVIKSIGYKTRITPLTEKLSRIILIEDEINLNEVVVSSLDFTRQLLLDCFKEEFDTLATSKQIILCQQYGKRNGTLKRFSEGVFNCEIDLSKKNFVKLDLLNSRALDDHMNEGFLFQNIKYGINLRNEIKRPFDAIKNTFFNRNYNYKLAGKTLVEGIECYKISFFIKTNIEVPNQFKSLITNGSICITVSDHKLKRIERNILSSDHKRKWFTSEVYSTDKGKTQIKSLALTSEILLDKMGFNIPPLGGLDIFFKPDSSIHVGDSYSKERKFQDLYTTLKQYNELIWANYYMVFNLKLSEAVLATFSEYGDIASQFLNNGKIH